MSDAYRNDLAYIHDAGFGQHARSAVPVLLDALRQQGLTNGLVIELGCGSGILSEAVAAAGYDVLGIDLSPAMVALARERVPGGQFRVGSFLEAELSPCVAVCAVGEIFSYLFDRGNTGRRLEQVFRRVHRALTDGGVFLFDVATPGRAAYRGYREGDGWAVLFTVEEDRPRRRLTRHITSFRKVGELYRRDAEVHRLRLYDPSELAARMREIGFRVRVLRGYGTTRFPRGLVGLLATKT